MEQSKSMEQSKPMEQSKSTEQSKPMEQSKNKIDNIPPSLFDMLNDSHLYLHPKNEKCVFNQYGQCIKGFRYFCAYCNYGVGGIYSLCHNSKCDIPKYDNSFDIQFSTNFDYIEEK